MYTNENALSFKKQVNWQRESENDKGSHQDSQFVFHFKAQTGGKEKKTNLLPQYKALNIVNTCKSTGGLKWRFIPLTSEVSNPSVKVVVNEKQNAATYKPWKPSKRWLGHMPSWGAVYSVGQGNCAPLPPPRLHNELMEPDWDSIQSPLQLFLKC